LLQSTACAEWPKTLGVTTWPAHLTDRSPNSLV